MASRSELKAAQKVWYAKLKAEGFDDIENDKGHIKKESSYFTKKDVVGKFEFTQTYFYNATQFLNDHKFENEYEKAVWDYHSNGLSSRQIASTLRKAGLKSNYDKVQKIILKLRRIMNFTQDK